tara:strand:- start:4991 stop:5530 length:540 start_codon:yes stop_codon:yes gene_type:complete
MIVYTTSNAANGNFYVGVHSGLKESYLGSGDNLRRAIDKYGRECFSRETIFEGTDAECLELEAFIVDEEFIARRDTYNICLGGGLPPVQYGNQHKTGHLDSDVSRQRKREAFSKSKTHAEHLRDKSKVAARIAKTTATREARGYVPQTTKGKKCYNDGVTNYFHVEGTQPKGLTQGMIR